ncbi:MAG: chloride channel protein [Nautiliaceae bacterium]
MITKLIFSALISGTIAGIFIVIYGLLTKFLSFLLFFGDPFETVPKLPVWYIYLVPMVSIFIVNYMISKNEAVKEYGVREIAEAIEKNRLIFGIKDLILKIFASSLSIASGFAIGNEGPSAAIGAMIANKIHGFLKLPKELLKVSLSVGASSGIAAIFVSPVTGIMFAIENLAYEFVRDFAGYLILASVVSFSIAWHFLEPLIFTYSTGKFIEYRYIVATVLFVPVITFFVFFYLSLKDRVLEFLNLKIIERFLPYRNFIFAVIGGGVIGTIMIITPYAAFSGHEVVKILINDSAHFPLWMIFLIIVLRIVATSVSLYANAVGGIFIALMSIGALVGYGFGEVLNFYFPFEIEPFYFAAIGAAVFMGVNMKLPLTAVVLALEMTYDYNVVVPTGISVVLVMFFVSLKFDLHKLHIRPVWRQ